MQKTTCEREFIIPPCPPRVQSFYFSPVTGRSRNSCFPLGLRLLWSHHLALSSSASLFRVARFMTSIPSFEKLFLLVDLANRCSAILLFRCCFRRSLRNQVPRQILPTWTGFFPNRTLPYISIESMRLYTYNSNKSFHFRRPPMDTCLEIILIRSPESTFPACNGNRK